MDSRSFWSTPVVRNLAGVLVLMLAWYLPDRFFFGQRTGFQKILPYLLLLTMYAWIVFHNRILLDRLYLSDKRQKYFLWTAIIMIAGSLNIYLVIRFIFNNSDPLPQILGYWVFTIAGAGVYLLFRYRDKIMERPTIRPVIVRNDVASNIKDFGFNADGRQHSLPVDSILYIESLENYIKVFTNQKSFVVRMSMKDAEQRLTPLFVRISRSHLVNPTHIVATNEDSVTIGGRELKIGKVYKKYVMEMISGMS